MLITLVVESGQKLNFKGMVLVLGGGRPARVQPYRANVIPVLRQTIEVAIGLLRRIIAFNDWLKGFSIRG